MKNRSGSVEADEMLCFQSGSDVKIDEWQAGEVMNSFKSFVTYYTVRKRKHLRSIAALDKEINHRKKVLFAIS